MTKERKPISFKEALERIKHRNRKERSLYEERVIQGDLRDSPLADFLNKMEDYLRDRHRF